MSVVLRGLMGRPGTNTRSTPYTLMVDPLEDILAPAVVERAMSIFESFKDRQQNDIVQARKAPRNMCFN
jgi:hypothetical protein